MTSKLLIVSGVVLLCVGVLLSTHVQIPWLGRLPGDIRIRKENFQIFLPITTSILISAFLSLLFYLFRK